MYLFWKSLGLHSTYHILHSTNVKCICMYIYIYILPFLKLKQMKFEVYLSLTILFLKFLTISINVILKYLDYFPFNAKLSVICC